jgi:hypothetical protein
LLRDETLFAFRGRTSNDKDEIQGFFAPLRMTTFYFTLAIFTFALSTLAIFILAISTLALVTLSQETPN